MMSIRELEPRQEGCSTRERSRNVQLRPDGEEGVRCRRCRKSMDPFVTSKKFWIVLAGIPPFLKIFFSAPMTNNKVLFLQRTVCPESPVRSF